MKISLPEKVSFIIKELQKNGHDAYAVGGCVRDSVLGREPQDWDITTSAKPEQVKEIFHYAGNADFRITDTSEDEVMQERENRCAFSHCYTIDTGIQHGTVTVMVDREGFEVTTYRIDGEYEDARHPKSVVFTENLLEDLKRRDFTINAMAYNDEIGFVDAFDGLGDLKRGIVRCVGRPEDRFQEDALRMMRAVRFAAQLGFQMDPVTREAIGPLAGNLAKISAERIQAELVKLLVSPHPEEIREVYETGMADVFLPEFSAMMRTPQHNPHHCGTVGEHTIWSLVQVPQDRVLRLAMLFHDVAKPVCLKTDAEGVDHFHGHPQMGAEMTGRIMRRLRFDNDTTARVKALIRAHDDRPLPLTERNVRRAIYRNGEAQYPDLFAVKRADILAQSDYLQKEKLEYVDQYEQIYNEIQEKAQCLSLKNLAVNGSDLIAAGATPGREIGRVLDLMLQDILDEPEMNTREILLGRFREGRY
ncbi:MAG: HD domain-containing protein [Clostridiales bacterium]|nr:HD domain-containing protein [Clostridiales bacterium]